MSVFVHAQGIKTVPAGEWGLKNGKILFKKLLNDPSAQMGKEKIKQRLCL